MTTLAKRSINEKNWHSFSFEFIKGIIGRISSGTEKLNPAQCKKRRTKNRN
jgi:hypothetical protein